MKAIRVHELGGPEVLRYEEIPAPTHGPGQALVKIEAIGLNFIDIYFRTGVYKTALPFVPGMEAAGTVTAVAPNVTEVQVGDRVAYSPAIGAYAEFAVVAAERLGKLPEGAGPRAAAAALPPGGTGED